MKLSNFLLLAMFTVVIGTYNSNAQYHDVPKSKKTNLVTSKSAKSKKTNLVASKSVKAKKIKEPVDKEDEENFKKLQEELGLTGREKNKAALIKADMDWKKELKKKQQNKNVNETKKKTPSKRNNN
ncbi:hypothetical protein [uncultured Aquimarina sp.]|uniref:hypothetical protein n=1 Tax=uncultured Aquimarina sp. TaxID=575652 RepID=UPI002639E5AB|nr:hypothetical protein [uncultured Aquimarina sp.]